MNPNARYISDNWTFSSNDLPSIVDSNIPSRNTNEKAHLLWITCEIKTMQRKYYKSHTKAKQTGHNNDWSRELRKQVAKPQPNPTETT